MINLLPPDRLVAMRLARLNTILRRYITMTLLGVVMLTAVIAGSHYYLDRQRGNTEQTVQLNRQKIKQLEPVQKQAEELSTTINTIAALQSRDVRFSDLLTKIGGLMPQGAVLTGLQFSLEDIKSPLVISAQVDSEQKAAILRNNLAASTLFSKADIQTITEGENAAAGTAGVPGNQDNASTGAANASPYKFTTVINAYFKDAKAISSEGQL